MPELCATRRVQMNCAEFSKLRIFLQNNPAEICHDLGRGINLGWDLFLDAHTKCFQIGRAHV